MKTIDLKKGFTLIELMTVIIVVGIIASLSIPGYRTIMSRTKQEKMRNTLRLIARYEEAFFLENGYYAPGEAGAESYTFEISHDGIASPQEVNLSNLPFVLPDNRTYDYRIYWVNNGEESYFYAQASASIGRGNDIDGDDKMDNWQVSSYNFEPEALSNDLGGDGTVEEGDEGGGDEGGEGEIEEGENGNGNGNGKGKGKGKEKEKKPKKPKKSKPFL
jgi:prepilin-type N-terminal cleavage/methylation domain-containing protein